MPPDETACRTNHLIAGSSPSPDVVKSQIQHAALMWGLFKHHEEADSTTRFSRIA
eukprot:CAMPEP_0206499476 /NCGR_PEP_ID=MMETSP0324_2-20121206/51745_1 /ASSEMBLY_ACC=CAM_ASM_000836 /TAXON_ID=2866 /ORGANISM="Crypthecodinium cohnii, Strain Seligo" /LENGTH=54 /DNA_ID=CAMNT_0053986127 /DNA_START=284 /DNA_END=445 /DNA_ORIENTATION=-